MDINKRITHFRNLKGYSVNRLAILSGVSQSYLREIELGNRNPTVEILSVLCDALDISLKEFFDDNTQNQFSKDPLLEKIYQLSSEQRESLLNFLKAMEN